MIIGSGLIGSSMAALKNADECIVFASGVANSRCEDIEQFDREERLLDDALELDGRFIYFSTCRSLVRNRYFDHKRSMEEKVRRRGNFIIFRLPPVASRSSNPHTLLNFLNGKIESGELFTVFSRASRPIIGIDDAVTIVDWLIKMGAVNDDVDIASPESYSIIEIVRELESIIGRKANFTIANSGDVLIFDPSDMNNCPVDFSGNYLRRTLRRYYG